MSKLRGIYQITCQATGMFYIGSSVDLRDRWTKHIRDLNKGHHHSPHLQNAWNFYGSDCFTFAVVEDGIDPGDLIAREQFWIDSLHACDRRVGYNVSPTAGSTLGKTHTAEAKRIMSVKRKEMGVFGSRAANAKFTDDQVLQIKVRLAQGETAQSIAKSFGVAHPTIDRIKSGKGWAHILLPDLTPEQLAAIPVRAQGTEKWNAKLTESDVAIIRFRLGRNEHVVRIAKEYGVSSATISKIKSNLIWKHVSPAE